jgi:hypothetical protein
MTVKRMIALSLLAVVVVGSFIAGNLIFTKKAEAILPPDTGYRIYMAYCCDLYAKRDCPKDLYTICFTDCYEHYDCDVY